MTVAHPFFPSSGDWDVHWGYDLDFDPWPHRVSGVPQCHRRPLRDEEHRPPESQPPAWLLTERPVPK